MIKVYYDRTTKEIKAITGIAHPNCDVALVEEDSELGQQIAGGAIVSIDDDGDARASGSDAQDLSDIDTEIAAAATFAEQQEWLAMRQLKILGITPAPGSPT